MTAICASFARLESFDLNSKFSCNSVLLSVIMKINMIFVLYGSCLSEF